MQSDITAHSGGGNLKLNLAGMSITRLSADTGGGNVDVDIPTGIAARIHATTGMGKTIIDPRFSKINTTYQSSDFDLAINKVEITVSSGAGNVSVKTL